jgi:hypothetical protein
MDCHKWWSQERNNTAVCAVSVLVFIWRDKGKIMKSFCHHRCELVKFEPSTSRIWIQTITATPVCCSKNTPFILGYFYVMKIENKTDKWQNVVDYSVVVTSHVKLVVLLHHEQNHNITAWTSYFSGTLLTSGSCTLSAHRAPGSCELLITEHLQNLIFSMPWSKLGTILWGRVSKQVTNGYKI